MGAYFNRKTTYQFSQGIHFGIDLSAPCGTEVVAVADGVVALVDARAYGSLPHNLIIDHPQLGYASLYGHLLRRPDLAAGQQVKAGQVVALSGDPDETCDGRPHLHLEIRDYPGRAWKYNPIPLMQADWDNLALVGSFRTGFERDLDDPRKWQQLDDQPPAVSGGRLLNDFARPWPRDTVTRDEMRQRLPPGLGNCRSAGGDCAGCVQWRGEACAATHRGRCGRSIPV